MAAKLTCSCLSWSFPLNQKMIHLPFFLFSLLLSLSAESSSFDLLVFGEGFPPSVLISYCSSASRIFFCWLLMLADGFNSLLLSAKASATPVTSLLGSSGLCYGKSLKKSSASTSSSNFIWSSPDSFNLMSFRLFSSYFCKSFNLFYLVFSSSMSS